MKKVTKTNPTTVNSTTKGVKLNLVISGIP